MHKYTQRGSVSYFEQVAEILNEEIDMIGKQIDDLYEAREVSENVYERIEITNQIRTLAKQGNEMIDDQANVLRQIEGMR